MSELIKDIRQKLGDRGNLLREHFRMKRKDLYGTHTFDRKTLNNYEHGRKACLVDIPIMMASEMMVHPAAMWNFSVGDNELFSELNASPCPFLKHNECFFLPNINPN